MKEVRYCPEMSDKEVLDMLAKIFGVGVGDYGRRSEGA